MCVTSIDVGGAGAASRTEDAAARGVNASRALKAGLAALTAAGSSEYHSMGAAAGARGTAMVRCRGVGDAGETGGAHRDVSTCRGAESHPLVARPLAVRLCDVGSGGGLPSAASLSLSLFPLPLFHPSKSLHYIPRRQCSRSSGAHGVILRGGGRVRGDIECAQMDRSHSLS